MTDSSAKMNTTATAEIITVVLIARTFAAPVKFASHGVVADASGVSDIRSEDEGDGEICGSSERDDAGA